MFTVAIVDDQPVTRTGLEMVISEAHDLKVVASVRSVAELDLVASPAAVVIMDLPQRPTGSILDDIGTLAGQSNVLVTSSWEQPPTVFAAMRAGARGCVTRRSDGRFILTALANVAEGGIYVAPDLVPRWSAEFGRRISDDPAGLAPREVETLRWIALGLTHAQVATRMGLTESTVNTYAKRIRAKLNACNKAQLTRMAIELGHLGDAHGNPAF